MSPEVALYTTCELCNAPMACVPGPRNLHVRPAAPNGFELGYLVEQRERSYPICQPCLTNVLNIAA